MKKLSCAILKGIFLLSINSVFSFPAFAEYNCSITPLRQVIGSFQIYRSTSQSFSTSEMRSPIAFDGLNIDQVHLSRDSYNYYWLRGKMTCSDSAHCALKGNVYSTLIDRSRGYNVFRGKAAGYWSIEVQNTDEIFLGLDSKNIVRIRCELIQNEGEQARSPDQINKGSVSYSSDELATGSPGLMAIPAY